MENITKYGLMEKSTGKLLTYYYSHNDNAEFCVDDTYKLTSNTIGDNIWMVDHKKIANLAKISTPWFNADYESPNHDFKEEDLQVVKITLSIEVDED